MWQHTEKYCLDKLTFIGTSALACQNALKYQLYIKQIFSWIFVICKCALYCCEMPLLSRQWLLIALYTGRFCHLQFCMLFPTKASLRLPTHINIYIYFFCATFCGEEGSSRNHQRLEGYLLNKICRGVSSTFCSCSFSPLYLKDCLKQIGS